MSPHITDEVEGQKSTCARSDDLPHHRRNSKYLEERVLGDTLNALTNAEEKECLAIVSVHAACFGEHAGELSLRSISFQHSTITVQGACTWSGLQLWSASSICRGNMYYDLGDI